MRNAMLDERSEAQGNPMMWDQPQPQQPWYRQPGYRPTNFMLDVANKAAGVVSNFLFPIARGDLHKAANEYELGARGDQELPSQAFDAAGGVMMGSSFARAPKNALRSFGGINAKNSDGESLKVAQAMNSKGADRKDIWDKTGWFQGVDGKWRFEIDDSGAKMSAVGLDKVRPLRDHMEHGALDSAYPNVMQTPTTRYAAISGPSGTASDEAIGLAQYPMQPLSEIRPVALHEGQHIIQGHEGFAKGGNFNSINSEPQYALAAEMKKSAELAKMGVEASKSGNTKDQMMYLEEFFKSQDKIKEIQGRTSSLTDADRRDFYRSLAGEVEARTVEARRDLTPEQRRQRAPWLDYDIPENKQVVRF